MFQYLLSFSTSVVASAFLTWCVRNVATRYKLAMHPPLSRHIHSIPTPRLGGVAVFLTFSSLYALYLVAAAHGWLMPPVSSAASRVLVISIPFFAVGLVDDLRGLSAWGKLAIQVTGATALYFSGIHFGFCSGAWFGGVAGQFLCWLLTAFWVVLICNAINLIDGLDGLAAGASLFSMVTIFSLAVGRPGVAVSTAILAGSLVGFLIFNFNPASIFLGDSGSLFVGFMLSGLVLSESKQQHSVVDAIFVPLISFALPLTDVTLSVLRRFLSGRSLFGADREHIHHKLLELGLTQRQVVWILYSFSAFSALLSLVLLRDSDAILLPVLAILLFSVFLGLRKLEYHEFAEFRRLGKSLKQQKKVFARNIAVRKAAARLENTYDLRSAIRILESCLRNDFDGFEIRVSDDLIAGNSFVGLGGEGCVKQFWRESPEEVILKLELIAGSGLPVGILALYQSADNDLLINTDLIKGDLRNAVAAAVCNIARAPGVTTVTLPAMKAVSLPSVYLGHETQPESRPV